MKERGILFSGAMVRALLAGTKTQTRRLIPDDWKPGIERIWMAQVKERAAEACPYGVPGDRLWVRETHFVERAGNADGSGRFILYRATDEQAPIDEQAWTPSIHMPRWASRITLEVTDVRVQRLQDISEEDARAEGIKYSDDPGGRHGGWRVGDEGMKHNTARWAFSHLWDSINGHKAPWSTSPWVWAVSFRRLP